MKADAIGVLASSQISVAVIGALVSSDHVPGPSSGTSTASAEPVSCPLSTPFATVSSGAFAIEPPLDAVELFEPAPERSLVLVGSVELTATLGGCVALGTVVGGPTFDEVAVAAVAVVVVVVVVGGGEAGNVTDPIVVEVVVVAALAWGGVPEDALSVNTSTNKSRGLDHRTQWLLFSERNGLIAILAG